MPNSAPAMKTVETSESSPTQQRDNCILSEQSFYRAIVLERKRTERSGRSLMLMLLDVGNCTSAQKRSKLLSGILLPLVRATRETDAIGWYKKDLSIGALFSDIGAEEKSSVLAVMLSRINDVLRTHLNVEQFSQLTLSFYVFPQDWEDNGEEPTSNPVLYPDVLRQDDAGKSARVIKRALDIVGSSAALVLFSPVFLVAALAIKLSSTGPVLFKQKRIGQHGTMFTFLKFRSMSVNNDTTVHKAYVRQLIAGKAGCNSAKNGEGVYKLTADPRVTAVGKFLRRTSIDELPQFINVLRGEMSLVGPRPPIAYEVEAYDLWHRRRLLEAKPGITGLWQINGRSRVKFDEMVRLDLQYARTWTPWLDLKILLRTPRAVISGSGAY